MLSDPEETLALVCPYDGAAGASVALDLLGITPALFVSLEDDLDCVEVVERAWPDAVHITRVERADTLALRKLFRQHPKLERILVIGGPPCPPE